MAEYRGRRERRHALVAGPLALVVMGATLGIGDEAPGAATTAAVDGTAPAEFTLTDGGVEPASLTVEVGATVTWVNGSSEEQQVVDTTGALDSGPIPSDGAFVAAMPEPGWIQASTAHGVTMDLQVVQSSIDGPHDGPFDDHVPAFGFPAYADLDLVEHPEFGIPTSRSLLQVGFVPDATVGEVNRALTAATTPIIGSRPSIGVLVVQAEGSDDLAGVLAAQVALEADPAVEVAALVMETAEQVVPAPADGGFASEYGWVWGETRTAGEPAGNWGLEAAAFPQAWNLTEAIAARAPSVATAVIDVGFEAHDGMPRLQIVDRWCSSWRTCTNNVPRDHGNNVAGIIGADPRPSDDAARSFGSVGGNPFGPLHGIRVGADAFDHVLDGIEAGDYPGVRVINHSIGYSLTDANAQAWLRIRETRNCGAEKCTPNTYQPWLDELARDGRIFQRAAERAAAMGVMIVQSAGNLGDVFPEGTILAANEAPGQWAALHWRSDLPNPIVVVEAVGGTEGATQPDTRAPFSSFSGDLAAPGVQILGPASSHEPPESHCPADPHSYCAMSGTSQAAPLVTAAIGLLLAYDPTLTIEEIRFLLREWGEPSGAANPTPRLHVFRSLLSLPGAARDLVDVNDPSLDGNRRVIRGPGGEELMLDLVTGATDDAFTAPDGRIDMRDFRRFRDAMLSACLDDPMDGCPERITLDGPDGHPKRDLNDDGCVFDPAAPDDCPTREQAFPRFDFNGDGRLDPIATALVPLRPDGRPAASRADATEMSDLEVFASQFDGGEGWAADDLAGLLDSGDLEIHPDPGGGSQLAVSITDPTSGDHLAPTRILDGGEAPLIMTTPANRPVRLTGTTAEGVVEYQADLHLAAGEDRRLDVGCGLQLVVDRPLLEADGADATPVGVILESCGGAFDVAGVDVTLEVAPTGEGFGELADATLTTNAYGHAITTFTSGVRSARYLVSASVEPEGARPGLHATATIDAMAPIDVHYVWRLDVVDYSKEGTTRWPEPLDPERPDCSVPGVVDRCVDSSWTGLHPDEHSSGYERRGIVHDRFDGAARLSETVGPAELRFRHEWSTSDPGGTRPVDGSSRGWITIPEAERDRYADHDLGSDVVIERLTDRIRVRGLATLGTLGYVHQVGEDQVVADPIDERFPWLIAPAPAEITAVPGELSLVPTASGETFVHSADPSAGLDFLAIGGDVETSTAYEPVTYCETRTIDLTLGRSYLLDLHTEWATSGVTYDVVEDYEPGLLPAPLGPGSATVRYAFAAVAAPQGSAVGDLDVPDCGSWVPPDDPGPDIEAAFEVDPTEPEEGRVVRFIDRSSGDVERVEERRWDLGDGTISFGSEVFHRYADDGDYEVTLTIRTDDGATVEAAQTVSVRNVAPTVEVDDLTVIEGTHALVGFRLYDPGTVDAQALMWEIGSSDPAIDTRTGTDPAGIVFVDLGVLDPGSYPLNVTVADKDGGSGSATGTLTVLDAASEPDDPGDPGVVPTCDPTVVVDEIEHEQVALLNAYRADNGLAPLVLSPRLTLAADRHSQDMADHAFVGHEGSDGSTYQQRAEDAGYSGAVGENAALAGFTGAAADVMALWRASPGHDANMLDAGWVAVGVARAQGDDGWYWTNVFGTVDDCLDVTTAASTSTSMPTTSSVSTSGAEDGPRILRVSSTSGEASTPLLPAFTISTLAPMVGEAVSIANRSRDLDGHAVPASLNAGDGSPVRTLAAEGTVTHAYDQAGDRTISLTGVGDLRVRAQLSISVTPRENAPPVADAGGPYEVSRGSALLLDARGSYDPDPDDAIATYWWDLDDDGHFGEVGGALVSLTWGEVETLICGGSCLADQPYRIGVQVTDLYGGRGTDHTTVTFDGSEDDFTLRLSPTSVSTSPGATFYLAIDVDKVGAFDDEVVLSIEGLPEGWTANLSPSALTPPGRSIARITTAADAAEEMVELQVVGESGELRRVANSTADLEFGLVPVCYGSLEGVVTDLSTGEPLTEGVVRLREGVHSSVRASATLGPDGSYRFDEVSVSFGNSPKWYYVTFHADGYWNTYGDQIVYCDITSTADLQAFAEPNVSGRVVVAEPTADGWAPSDEPVHDALVRQAAAGETTWRTLGRSDVDGGFEGPLRSTSYSNRGHPPQNHRLQVSAPDFRPTTQSIRVEGPDVEDQTIALRRLCYNRFEGGVVTRSDTDEPVAGLPVRLEYRTAAGFLRTLLRTTDSEGAYNFGTEIPLINLMNDRDEQRITVRFSAPTESGLYTRTVPLDLDDCDAEPITLDVALNPRPEPDPPAYSTIEGTVRHSETGEPFVDASVRVLFGSTSRSTRTDDVGRYRFDEVPLGTGATQRTVTVRAFDRMVDPDYWTSQTTLIARKDEVHTVDLALRPIDFASIEGTVRDRTSGEPVANAMVDLGGVTGVTPVTTDVDGRYRIERLRPNEDGSPRSAWVRAERRYQQPRYWRDSAPFVIEPGGAVVRDLDLLRYCEDPIRITGLVLDSTTRLPIEGAAVSGGGDWQRTDADGRFTLTSTQLGTDNQPTTYSVTASAAGYVSQTKRVTVFCGATIVLDFGPPPSGTGSIVGTVVDQDGQPLADVFVGSTFGVAASTEADGSYRIEDAPLGPDLAPRTWAVHALHDGYEPASLEIQVGPDEPARADLVLVATTSTSPPDEDDEDPADPPEQPEPPEEEPPGAPDPDPDPVTPPAPGPDPDAVPGPTPVPDPADEPPRQVAAFPSLPWSDPEEPPGVSEEQVSEPAPVEVLAGRASSPGGRAIPRTGFPLLALVLLGVVSLLFGVLLRSPRPSRRRRRVPR